MDPSTSRVGMREEARCEVVGNACKFSIRISNIVKGDLGTGSCSIVLKTLKRSERGAVKLVW
jgi:hypothetical protein